MIRILLLLLLPLAVHAADKPVVPLRKSILPHFDAEQFVGRKPVIHADGGVLEHSLEVVLRARAYGDTWVGLCCKAAQLYGETCLRRGIKQQEHSVARRSFAGIAWE